MFKKLFGKNYRVRDFFIDILFSIVGSAFVGLSFAVFTVPNNIAPGGVSGLATALATITPITVGIWSAMLNVPLLLLALRNLGFHSILFTLISTALCSLFIDLGGIYLPLYTNNTTLAALYGGVFSGLGIGLLFLRNISTGGTDLLALILKKFFKNVPTGTLLLISDATVVLIAVLIFRDIDVALYSAITIFVSSKVIDAITTGIDTAKVVYIVTDHGTEMADYLNENTERGCTIIPAIGGYSKKNKQMIMTVTRRNFLAQTFQMIRKVDPDSFAFVVNSAEVHGEGFKID